MLLLRFWRVSSVTDTEENVRKIFYRKYYLIRDIAHELFGPLAPEADLSGQGAPKIETINFPKTNILIFSGNLMTWPTFYGYLNSLLNSQSHLSCKQ